MAAGLGTIAVGIVVCCRIDARGGLLVLGIGVALSGLGIGISAVASTNLAVSSVPSERQGTASGLVNTATQLGTAVGVALLVTLAEQAGARESAEAATAVAGYRTAFLAAAAMAIVAAIGTLVLRRSIRQPEMPSRIA